VWQVKAGRKLKLRPYEDFLKKFQYQNALDAALEVQSCASPLTVTLPHSHPHPHPHPHPH
jgi:hypothetical protein